MIYIFSKSDKNYSILHSISIFFIIITIIFNSGSVWSTVYTKIGFFMLIISFFILISIYKIDYDINKKVTFYTFSIFSLLALIIISFIVNTDITYLSTTIKLVMIILFSYKLTKEISFDNYVDYYINVMKVVCVISLIPFLIHNYLHIDIYSKLPIITNVNDVSYYNGSLFYTYTYSQTRNIGIFWEPALYSNYITLAMLLMVCFKKKIDFLAVTIFVVTILTTKSIGGYFLFCLVICIGIFNQAINFNKRYDIVFFIFILLLLLFGGFVLFPIEILNVLAEYMPVLFSKFVRGDAPSVTERMASPIYNLKLFSQSPLFGYGTSIVNKKYSEFGIAQLSTSTYYLAMLGIGGFIYSILIIVGSFMQKNIPVISRFLLASVLLIMVNKESNMYFIAIYIFLFYLVKVSDFSEKEHC